MSTEFYHAKGDTIRLNQSYVQMVLTQISGKKPEEKGLTQQTIYELSNIDRWDCLVDGVGELDWRKRGLFSPAPSLYWIRLTPDFPVTPVDKPMTLFFTDKNVMDNCFYRLNRPVSD